MGINIINQHKVFFAILILLGAGIVAVQAGAYYYYQKSTGTCPGPCATSSLPVQTLINYGNGTLQWINKTNVPSNWNFYQLTANITRVQAKYYGAPTSEHFVTAINGVQSSGSYFWSLWAICGKSNAWYATNVGADAVHFTTYRVLAWYYQSANSQDSSYWNPPIPGALKVNSC